MKFGRKLYPEAKQHPNLFKSLTSITLQDFNTLLQRIPLKTICQGAINTGHYHSFQMEFLFYYLIILNHGLTKKCISDLASISDGDAARLLNRFGKFCGDVDDKLLKNIDERLYLRSRFIFEHKFDTKRLPSSGVSSIWYLQLLLPDKLHRKFEYMLNPKSKYATTIQAFFRGHQVRQALQKERATQELAENTSKLSLNASLPK